MRASALALLLLLGACAAAVPPAPPLAYPPAARERMLRIVLAEWAEWGEVLAPADAGPPASGAESDPANFPRVLAYWRAVPEDEGAIAHNRTLYAAALEGRAEGATLWQAPYWSAAFIS